MKIKTNLFKNQYPCEICGDIATEKHHRFSNSKVNRKLYSKLIDDDRNIMFLCQACHVAFKPKFDEKEFCEKLGIKIRGKSYGFRQQIYN